MARVTLTNGGVELVADVEGPARGPTTLLLHAGGETRSVWSPISCSLVAAGWRTIAPDLRGHGESGRSPRYRLDDFVADAEVIVGALADRPLAIVGGSIGGALGLLLAGEIGLAVDALVLLDVPTAPSPAAAQQERARIAAARSAGVPALMPLDPEVMTGTFVDDVVADLDRWRRAARRIHVPVLLIRGTRSSGIGTSELSAFADDLPHGEICDVDAGHLVARDQPRQVARMVTAFLARVWVR